MASLQVTPAAAFAEYKELNFQGLYLYHLWSGSKANQTRVVGNNSTIGIGAIDVNNWEVYDGTGSDAKLVARAQGAHIYAGNWLSTFSLVFERESGFSGSTLEVTGIVVENGESAIAGGTGQFAMANGVVTKKYLKDISGGNIIQLTIHAFCPVLNGPRYYPVTKIGPWGGSGGSPMDLTEAPKRLESISVSTGIAVTAIEFSYVDFAGQKRSTGRWGGSGGNTEEPIQLAESEVLAEVSGTIGVVDGQTVITSIKFVTNLNKTYGPWGSSVDGRDTTFAVPVQAGGGIVGFFARTAGTYLDAIGVYVRAQ